MTSRRAFVTMLAAAGAAPRIGWAEAGSPAFLAAGKRPDGTHALCGLDETGGITFQIPLPSRGHAAAGHPARAEAVAFARRPGTFAIVLDCPTGREIARLTAPEGRHFYGHGAFSADGRILYTTENDFDAARGMVGLWDAANCYRRIGEFPSGGTGPHDIRLMADAKTLVVANGGIETHPEAGRAKLNIPMMRPNLAYLSTDGQAEEIVELDPALHKASIRHLALGPDGVVAFAMQWEGDLTDDAPLLAVHTRGAEQPLRFAEAASIRRMHGYLGSIAASGDGRTLSVTSPRSGTLLTLDLASLSLLETIPLADVCGVAGTAQGFLATTGTGLVTRAGADTGKTHAIHWDNHLIAI